MDFKNSNCFLWVWIKSLVAFVGISYVSLQLHSLFFCCSWGNGKIEVGKNSRRKIGIRIRVVHIFHQSNFYRNIQKNILGISFSKIQWSSTVNFQWWSWVGRKGIIQVERVRTESKMSLVHIIEKKEDREILGIFNFQGILLFSLMHILGKLPNMKNVFSWLLENVISY